MKNIRFLSVVMLSISVFLCASYAYATTEQKNEKLEEPQKIIRIVVEQSYSDKTYSPVEGINLPFESIARKLLEYADLKVAPPESENYNLILKIQAKGEALGTEYSPFGFGKGTYYYTGASLKGEISLELSGIPINEKSFSGYISPPSRIDRSQMSSSPSSAPFRDTLWWQPNSFGPMIIKLIEEISSPKFLINAMKDEDSNIREFSNRFLYGLGEEAVDPLISFLKEEDSFILLKVVMALGNIKDPRAIEPLIEVLKNKDSKVRESAVVALKRFGETAVEPLISALQAENLEVRRSVIKILGQIKDPRAIEPLIEVLKNKDSEVRKSAVNALGQIKDPRAVEPLIATLKDEDAEVRKSAVKAFEELGETAIEPLIVALKDEDVEVRSNAANALGQIKDSRAVEPLIMALKDEDTEVRKNAVNALGQLKDPRAVEPLISTLQAEDLEVRRSVIKILGQIKDSRAVEPLIMALEDEDAEVRSNAANALGQIKDSRAVEPLIVALKYEDSKVRENIVKAIKEIGEAAVDILIKTLQSEDFDIRVLAAWALGQIGDSRAIDPLIAALQDKEFFVQAKVAEALGEIQDSRAIEPLIEIMKSGNILVKKHTADALKKITEQSFGMDYKAWSKWWKEHKE